MANRVRKETPAPLQLPMLDCAATIPLTYALRYSTMNTREVQTKAWLNSYSLFRQSKYSRNEYLRPEENSSTLGYLVFASNKTFAMMIPPVVSTH